MNLKAVVNQEWVQSWLLLFKYRYSHGWCESVTRTVVDVSNIAFLGQVQSWMLIIRQKIIVDVSNIAFIGQLQSWMLLIRHKNSRGCKYM